jgi:hypothetical protein
VGIPLEPLVEADAVVLGESMEKFRGESRGQKWYACKILRR